MNAATPDRIVLLTGATGFLGTQVARRLVLETNLTVIALVRAEDQAAAAQRLLRSWWDWPELANAVTGEGRVEVLAGDVTLTHLGLAESTYNLLAGRVTHIIHTAADLRIDAPLDELRQTNVQGTANILDLARLAHHDHGLERYAHISTAYVAGKRAGIIPEEDLSDEHGFSNPYELSKYEGECLVQTAKNELPVSIFRPGMVVGASDTGEIQTFNTVYFPLKLYLSGKFPVLPGNPALPVNIVPVDYVADAITRLTFCPDARGLTFHLTAPTQSLPNAGELVEFVRDWASEQLGLRLRRPTFLNLHLPRMRYQPGGARNENHSGMSFVSQLKTRWPILKGLLAYLPYLNDWKQFQRHNVDRLLGPYPLEWREYLPRLLAYAVDHSFMHRTERTVHEQLLARLQSKNHPVDYFDIVHGKLVHHTSAEVRQDILIAASALKALSIQPGERVAIVGLNSTRYLVLDTAISLVGAVSVPLYYTSPPAEIDHILSASGARLLLVGAPEILDRLAEIHSELPVVSFYREASLQGQDGRVISWDAFMALGAAHPASPRSPVDFGDLATLRYTSGTTGQPKGVSFQHQHLRWMAQTMVSLLPWKYRGRRAEYVSFLPMNHVVEGILATYSPYYIPAPVSIYFLEDLKEIRHALQQVRPTIFFSVPRIYEKIWEALESNPLGQRYLGLSNGLYKRVLRFLLHRQTLKKAGLDRCAQLLVGSAPCSQELLQNFRDLGVEIYNAYGLTEAPLITLNRPGANHLGTVGEPLPQTQICLADDGEVMVRGPQVMAGYFDKLAAGDIVQPIRNGWLLTGDLGYFTPDGSLVLNGRKKELFKTSYGKYVQPDKVESLLRDIPGVAEAMLVGEQRPYCVALLWVQENGLDTRNEQRIDHLVSQVNHSLSHPEQVKRWALLPNDLSIETGDLTANLKLKRQAINRRLAGVLNCLYDGLCPSQGVLHMGEAGKV